MEAQHDDVRRMLICEPRGSVARHVNLIVPSTRPDCVTGSIVSDTICVATVLLEAGIVPMQEPQTRLRHDFRRQPAP